MKIIFKTNIDKFKNKFPTNFKVIPRVGEFVKIEQGYEAPFDKLQVVSVTYVSSELVEVELHLSDLQHRQNKEYKLGVFNLD